ncbi:lipoprotein [Williamsoniiplasma luminosum]|uniref:Lipoprotein n=1 Tax=Williamsoniiplasma luminosum TaxID=214888 RepID=A0A2S0NKF4_9MOLU|nr:lipoprotein [Williamsoniiplasma luminosum]AVP49491.1 MAG: hypothetical protein C5T88_02850 [Williamsoniiplasma luminosum]
MKKILNILGTLALTATTSVSVVSCEKPKTTENNTEDKPNNSNIKTPYLNALKEEIIKAQNIKQEAKQTDAWKSLQNAIEQAESVTKEEEALEATDELLKAIKSFYEPQNKIELKSYIKNTNLGYISSEKVIKEALKIKNPDIPRKVLKNIEYKDRILRDKTGQLSGEVKIEFNDKFKNEWDIDKEGVITASELGLEDLDGTLKVKERTGDAFLYKRTTSSNNLIDLTKKEASSIPEGIKDYAWWKGNKYITIDESTDILKIYQIENKEWKWIENLEVKYGYWNDEKPKTNYHWDMIDRIDDNSFSIATMIAKNDTSQTIVNAFTKLQITNNEVSAKVNKYVGGADEWTVALKGIVNGSNAYDLEYFGIAKGYYGFLNGLIGVSPMYINLKKSLPDMENDIDPNRAEYISITRAEMTRWPTGVNWKGETALYWGIANMKYNGYNIVISYHDGIGVEQGNFDHLNEENTGLSEIKWDDDDLGIPISIIQDKTGKIWVNTKDAIYPLVYWTC